VFTMAIRSAGKTVVRTAKSHPGEEREDTLRRLYHEMLPPNDPRRRVVFMPDRGSEVGSPTDMVIMGSDDRDERQDPPVFITPEPPQF
jgi:hypothetical protein